MAGWTNRGKAKMWDFFFRGASAPANFKLVLITAAGTVDADTNDMTGLTEIAPNTSGGYQTGGLTVTRDVSATGFQTPGEDDAGNLASVKVANRSWTAPAGEPIPASGGAATRALLLDASGDVIAYWSLGGSIVASPGQVLTLQNPELQLTNVIGVTNRGKKRIMQAYLAAVSVPANFNLILCTTATGGATIPFEPDLNTQSELTQIANGNGYVTDGKTIARSSVGFEAVSEDDAGDKSAIQMQDQTWTAAGGAIPISGSGARWAVLVDDNATPGSRDIILGWDLGSDRTVSSGQNLVIKDAPIHCLEA